MLKLWNRKNQGCRHGSPFVFSEAAIEVLLIVSQSLPPYLSKRRRDWTEHVFLPQSLGITRSQLYVTLQTFKTLNVSLKVYGKRGPPLFSEVSQILVLTV